MKKLVNRLLVVLLSALLLSVSVLPAYATSSVKDNSGAVTLSTSTGISPRLTNCVDATFTFSVISGDGIFAVTYHGYDTFTYAKLTVKVEKLIIGTLWADQGDWTGYCYDQSGRFYDSIPVSGTGIFKATFTLEVHGTTGVVDVLEDSIMCKYNG